jgi:hypothetical protein
MATFGKWGTKTFKVDTKSIYRPTDLTRKGTGTRNSITNLPDGKDPEEIAFTIKLGTMAGVNVRTEIEWWLASINKANALIIGGTRYGQSDMILDSVEAGGHLVTDFGTILESEIKLSFSAKPSWGDIVSALTSDARQRAESSSDDKEKYQILNAELTAALDAAKNIYNAT